MTAEEIDTGGGDTITTKGYLPANILEQHNYNGIHATIIADSLNEFGNRLTTFVVSFPRMVLAEFNTHRVFSRNSASSRAIPFNKMVKRCEETPFIPIKWQKDHKGMQGTEYWSNDETVQEAADVHTPAVEYFERVWLASRDEAVFRACHLSQKGLTKQLCNRLLEPFMWHTVIVTSSEWGNFFAQRAHEAAEIHIADLAHKMLEQYNLSKPNILKAGEWHIPFGDSFDEDRLRNDLEIYGLITPVNVKRYQKAKVKIATARCARISYFNFEGKDDYLADITLHDRLMEMGHWSPFEHCAKSMSETEYNTYGHNFPILNDKNEAIPGMGRSSFGWSGNFRGFVQYRKTFEEENKKDPRVIKK